MFKFIYNNTEFLENKEKFYSFVKNNLELLSAGGFEFGKFEFDKQLFWELINLAKASYENDQIIKFFKKNVAVLKENFFKWQEDEEFVSEIIKYVPDLFFILKEEEKLKPKFEFIDLSLENRKIKLSNYKPGQYTLKINHKNKNHTPTTIKFNLNYEDKGVKWIDISRYVLNEDLSSYALLNENVQIGLIELDN